MDIETKEIREAPSTEEKNADIKSGTLPERRYAVRPPSEYPESPNYRKPGESED